jgi:phosphate/sulfate permease
VTSGALWSFWIMQDAANVAIYLPRQLSLTQFIVFAGSIFMGMGLLFYLKGDKIQSIVDEKAGVSDIRAATLVDFVYAGLIYYLKIQSNIPISTTWVFIGLLGGRELAIALSKKRRRNRLRKSKMATRMIFKDALKAFIGLVVSLLLAFLANENMREQLFSYLSR